MRSLGIMRHRSTSRGTSRHPDHEPSVRCNPFQKLTDKKSLVPWSDGLASPLTTALTKVWNLEGPGRSIVVRATVRFFVRLLNPQPMRAARCRASPSPAPHPYTARATPTRHTARTHMLSRRMLLPSMSSAPEASSQSRSHPTASASPAYLGGAPSLPRTRALGALAPSSHSTSKRTPWPKVRWVVEGPRRQPRL